MLDKLSKCIAFYVLAAIPLVGQAVPAVSSRDLLGNTHSSELSSKSMSESRVAIKVPTPAEQKPAQPPVVRYRDGQLVIDAEDCTLDDVLEAVRQKTGADIDPPPVNGHERLVAHLAGSPRVVISSLLEGTHIGYIIIGLPGNQDGIQKVVFSILKDRSHEVTIETAPAKSLQPQLPRAEPVAAPTPFDVVPMDPAQIDPSHTQMGSRPQLVPPLSQAGAQGKPVQ